MLFRFCLYGFLKNQRYFEPFLMLALMARDLSFFWIGVLYSTRWVTLNLLEIPSGFLADWWGRRRCMVSSFIAYTICFLLFAFSKSLITLAVAMILFGIGDSFRTGTHKAMIFQWLHLQNREAERTKVYGLTRSWSKFGSALSSILAAFLLLWTGRMDRIFLFATIPCLLNIVNLLSYPAELDAPGKASQNKSNTATVRFRDSFRAALASVWVAKPLRRLVGESMAWEGTFHAVKDYLQPAMFLLILGSSAQQIQAFKQDNTTMDPRLIIGLSIVYTGMFFLSGLASRNAHMIVKWSGGMSQATSRIWGMTFPIYLSIALGSWMLWPAVSVMAFALLMILQNVWRPIIVSRFDEHAEAKFGATVLSVESQAQRLATLALAPLIGWLIDRASSSSEPNQLWPLGILGAGIALVMLCLTRWQRETFDTSEDGDTDSLPARNASSH